MLSRITNSIDEIFSKKDTVYIQKNKQLREVLELLRKEKILGIDTEFNWRSTYFPSLCLIQVSTLKNIFLIDCQQVDAKIINEIFQDNSITKVFHSIRGDITVLKLCLNSLVRNIFDTQIAHSILNPLSQQISYKDLVNKYFIKLLDKKETNSDWSKRPLSATQLEYASDDVRYLLKIMSIQIKALEKQNLTMIFKENCKEERKLGEQDLIISRVNKYKKSKNISDLEITLFTEREKLAQDLNIPTSRIMKNSYLKKYSKSITENNSLKVRELLEDICRKKSIL